MSYRQVTIPLPIGLGGFNGSRNQSRLEPNELSFVEGVDIDGGVIRKEGGATKYNDDALGDPSKVLAGINWAATFSQSYDVVFLDNGDVLRDNGDESFDTTLASGLSVDDEPPPVFVEAGAETAGADASLFMFSATNQVQVVDGSGTSFASISDPPSDWADSQFPTFGVLHGGRLWGGGNASDPHRIYYSTTDDHEDFLNGGTLAIFPGEGGHLVGGMSFNGLLILFKRPLGVYVVDTREPSPSNWQVSRLSRAVGGINQSTIVQIDQDVIYLDSSGNLHRLSRTARFGDVETSNVGQSRELGTFLRDSVNLGRLRKAAALWYPARSQAWFMLPRSGAEENDIRLVADFSDSEVEQRFLLSRRDKFMSLWTRPDIDGVRRPAAGDTDGFVWNLDIETRSKDDNAYDMEFETATTDFAWANRQYGYRVKNGAFLEIVADVAGQFKLNVDVYWDEDLTDTKIFEFGASGEVLGSFELDSDELASSGIDTIRKRIAGSGRRLQLKISNNDIEDVRISEVRVSFGVGDEDAIGEAG